MCVFWGEGDVAFHGVHMEVREQLVGTDSTMLVLGSQTQVTQLGRKGLCLLIHPAGPLGGVVIVYLGVGVS